MNNFNFGTVTLEILLFQEHESNLGSLLHNKNFYIPWTACMLEEY